MCVAYLWLVTLHTKKKIMFGQYVKIMFYFEIVYNCHFYSTDKKQYQGAQSSHLH